MASTINVDDLKISINQIQEIAVDHFIEVPEIKELSEASDEKLRTVYKKLKMLKNEELILKTKTEETNVKLEHLRVVECKQNKELEKLQQDGDFYQHLLAVEQDEIVKYLETFEHTLRTLANSFRSGPLSYEPESLVNKLDVMRQSAVELSDELGCFNKEMACIKEIYDPHTPQWSAIRQIIQALDTVMTDSVIRDILDEFTKKEKEYLQAAESLKQELGQLLTVVAQLEMQD